MGLRKKSSFAENNVANHIKQILTTCKIGYNDVNAKIRVKMLRKYNFARIYIFTHVIQFLLIVFNLSNRHACATNYFKPKLSQKEFFGN